MKTDTFPAKQLVSWKYKRIIEWQEVIYYLDTYVYISNDAADDVVICCKMLIDQVVSRWNILFHEGRFGVQPGFKTPP